MSSLRLPALTIASVLAAAALWSCSKNDAPKSEQTGSQAQEHPSAQMPAAGGDMMQQLRSGCPMVVDGAEVAVADSEEGVALTFTTEAGDVGDLRARVRHMAQMYGHDSSCSPPMRPSSKTCASTPDGISSECKLVSAGCSRARGPLRGMIRSRHALA